jgi:hypothetical protein
VEIAASISPISVIFLRFATGQRIGEIIGNSNDLQHMRREVPRGLTVQVVAGSEGEATQIFEGLIETALSRLTVTPILEPSGFTDFVVHQKIDRILSHAG